MCSFTRDCEYPMLKEKLEEKMDTASVGLKDSGKSVAFRCQCQPCRCPSEERNETEQEGQREASATRPF